MKAVEADELDAVRRELQQLRADHLDRTDDDPDGAEQGVARLLLMLSERLRQLLERQAIQRMDAGSLTVEEVERMGLALMRHQETIQELTALFGLRARDLNINLGSLGLRE